MRGLQPTGTKPVLKWAGGKRRLLPHLLAAMPERFGRYLEPMVGGGALFFALAPARGLIADRNGELINFYQVLARDPNALIAAARAWPVTADSFYAVRALRFADLPPVVAAARLLFLNWTCFNGLYRVNRAGQFNVPWGRYARDRVIDAPALDAAHRALQGVTIIEGGYADVLRAEAGPGDLVFLDPPYLPVSVHSDFRRYTADPFGEAEHRAMRGLVDELSARGCTTLVTNANHPLMHELYGGLPMQVLPTERSINARGPRRVVEDVLVVAGPR